MKILIAESLSSIRRILKEMLQSMGFECVEAEDGIEALQMFDDSVGFVITEWDLSKLSGLDVVGALRRRDDGRDVPILMICASNPPGGIQAAREVGVDDYLAKPFTSEELGAKIEAMSSRA